MATLAWNSTRKLAHPRHATSAANYYPRRRKAGHVEKNLCPSPPKPSAPTSMPPPCRLNAPAPARAGSTASRLWRSACTACPPSPQRENGHRCGASRDPLHHHRCGKGSQTALTIHTSCMLSVKRSVGPSGTGAQEPTTTAENAPSDFCVRFSCGWFSLLLDLLLGGDLGTIR